MVGFFFWVLITMLVMIKQIFLGPLSPDGMILRFRKPQLSSEGSS